MSPTKYGEGNNDNAPNPMQRMAKLDEGGQPYWLKNVRTVGGIVFISADVVAHDGDWLHIQDQEGDRARIWLNLRQIVSFEMVEG